MTAQYARSASPAGSFGVPIGAFIPQGPPHQQHVTLPQRITSLERAMASRPDIEKLLMEVGELQAADAALLQALHGRLTTDSHAVPLPPPAPGPTAMASFVGRLCDGDDIEVGMMTVDEAKAKCLAYPDAVGFTLRRRGADEPPGDGTDLIAIKSRWAMVDDPGWLSFAKGTVACGCGETFCAPGARLWSCCGERHEFGDCSATPHGGHWGQYKLHSTNGSGCGGRAAFYGAKLEPTGSFGINEPPSSSLPPDDTFARQPGGPAASIQRYHSNTSADAPREAEDYCRQSSRSTAMPHGEGRMLDGGSAPGSERAGDGTARISHPSQNIMEPTSSAQQAVDDRASHPSFASTGPEASRAPAPEPSVASASPVGMMDSVPLAASPRSGSSSPAVAEPYVSVPRSSRGAQQQAPQQDARAVQDNWEKHLEIARKHATTTNDLATALAKIAYSSPTAAHPISPALRGHDQADGVKEESSPARSAWRAGSRGAEDVWKIRAARGLGTAYSTAAQTPFTPHDHVTARLWQELELAGVDTSSLALEMARYLAEHEGEGGKVPVTVDPTASKPLADAVSPPSGGEETGGSPPRGTEGMTAGQAAMIMQNISALRDEVARLRNAVESPRRREGSRSTDPTSAPPTPPAIGMSRAKVSKPLRIISHRPPGPNFKFEVAKLLSIDPGYIEVRGVDPLCIRFTTGDSGVHAGRLAATFAERCRPPDPFALANQITSAEEISELSFSMLEATRTSRLPASVPPTPAPALPPGASVPPSPAPLVPHSPSAVPFPANPQPSPALTADPLRSPHPSHPQPHQSHPPSSHHASQAALQSQYDPIPEAQPTLPSRHSSASFVPIGHSSETKEPHNASLSTLHRTQLPSNNPKVPTPIFPRADYSASPALSQAKSLLGLWGASTAT